jgi:hypothetical protein
MRKRDLKFIIPLVLFFSCMQKNSPEKVANDFLNAFSKKNFSEAKSYCTPETVKLVEIAESLSKLSTAKNDFINKEYEILSQDIHGEKGEVKFKEKGSDEIQKMKLERINGQWLVAVTKEDVMAKESSKQQ